MSTADVLSDDDLAVIERECDSHLPPLSCHEIRLLVREVRQHRAKRLTAANIEALVFARHIVKQRRGTFDIAGTEQDRYDAALAVLDKLVEDAPTFQSAVDTATRST